MTTVAEVSSWLREHRATWLSHVFPNGRLTRGTFYLGDAEGAAGGSLPIELKGAHKTLRDFGGDFSGDDLALFARKMGLGMAEAAAEAAAMFDIPRINGHTKGNGRALDRRAEPSPQLVRPVPPDAPALPVADYRGRKPIAWHEYTDGDGRPTFYVARFDSRRDKCLPCTLWSESGQLVWKFKGVPVPRSLYRHEALAARPNDPVLIVEGEKATEAAERTDELSGYVVVTWPGGAGGVNHADWSPLKGRDAAFWPDNDPAGRACAETGARLALVAGARSVRVVRLPDGLPEGWDLADSLPAGWTLDNAAALIDQAAPIEAARPPDAADVQPFRPTPFEPFDPAAMPLRPWVLGNSVLRRAPTAVSAPGGHNKTTLLVQRAIAVVTGRPITGEKVWTPGPAWYISLEEDGDEIRRRIAAVCLEFSIPQEELRERLLIGVGDVPAVTLAELQDGNAVATIDIDRMTNTAIQHGIVYLAIDPLVQFHKVSENANEQMAVVVRQCGLIAERADCAVDFAAHARKGATAGDPDATRGASAIRDGVRKLVTLAAMTIEEAAQLGIKVDERKRFVRLDDAKGNYSDPDSSISWFRRISVPLGNGRDDRPDDQIGVLRAVDMAEWQVDRMRTAEPERQSLAQALCDAMPASRSFVRDVLGVAMDHGRACKERAGYDRIIAAVPRAPGFRRVTYDGKPWRLYLVRSDPERSNSPMEITRCAEPE